MPVQQNPDMNHRWSFTRPFHLLVIISCYPHLEVNVLPSSIRIHKSICTILSLALSEWVSEHRRMKEPDSAKLYEKFRWLWWICQRVACNISSFINDSSSKEHRMGGTNAHRWHKILVHCKGLCKHFKAINTLHIDNRIYIYIHTYMMIWSILTRCNYERERKKRWMKGEISSHQITCTTWRHSNHIIEVTSD